MKLKYVVSDVVVVSDVSGGFAYRIRTWTHLGFCRSYRSKLDVKNSFSFAVKFPTLNSLMCHSNYGGTDEMHPKDASCQKFNFY